MAVKQYQAGATDYNRVFNVLGVLVNQQDQLALSQGAIPNSLIAAYKALGGGWEIRNGDFQADVSGEEVPAPVVLVPVVDNLPPPEPADLP